MRPSLPLFVRIVLRNSVQSVKGRKPEIVPEPIPRTKETKVILIEEMIKIKDSMGSSWPPNLRIEPVVTKKTLARVHGDYRTELKALLKEK